MISNFGLIMLCTIIAIGTGVVIAVSKNEGRDNRENNKPNKATVVIYGVCAVIWTIRAIFEIAYQTFNDSVFWFLLNVLCAVVWIAAFIVNMKKYRSNN